jgi:hypothetical protein
MADGPVGGLARNALPIRAERQSADLLNPSIRYQDVSGAMRLSFRMHF